MSRRPRGLLPDGVDRPEQLAGRLAATGYLADRGLATACFLGLALGRPLLLEGEAGTGKTSVAHALAELLDAPLERLQCYEGIDASQALYDWDFPRQLLHVRAHPSGHADDVEAHLYDRRFLLARPLLRALETSPCVLLIDEIDRADDEFEAFLLEILSEWTVTIPELGTVRAATPPVVVLTSNRTREVHDALKRRCYYHWLPHPDADRELAIVRTRLPRVTERLAREVVAVVQALRSHDLVKVPGVAETLDWAAALDTLGAQELEPDVAAASLGAVVKHQEDLERLVASDVGALVRRAVAS